MNNVINTPVTYAQIKVSNVRSLTAQSSQANAQVEAGDGAAAVAAAKKLTLTNLNYELTKLAVPNAESVEVSLSRHRNVLNPQLSSQSAPEASLC